MGSRYRLGYLYTREESEACATLGILHGFKGGSTDGLVMMMQFLMSDAFLMMLATGVGIAVAVAFLLRSMSTSRYARFASAMCFHFIKVGIVLILPVMVLTRLIAPQATDLDWMLDAVWELLVPTFLALLPWMALILSVGGSPVQSPTAVFLPFLVFIVMSIGTVLGLRFILTRFDFLTQYILPVALILQLFSSIEAGTEFARYPVDVENAPRITQRYGEYFPVRHVSIMMYVLGLLLYYVVPVMSQALASVYAANSDVYLWSSILYGGGLIGLSMLGSALITVLGIFFRVLVQGIEETDMVLAAEVYHDTVRNPQ